jgi:hypothetical protein
MIKEEKSVSSVVINFTDMLSNRITTEVNNTIKFGSVLYNSNFGLKIPFVQGRFVFDLSRFSKYLKNTVVRYVIYVTDEKQYSKLYKYSGINFNSQADYESASIDIVSIMINSEMISNFKSTIAHELTHLYQYSQGLKKNIDLYDISIKLASSRNALTQAIGYCLYCSFKHEQDAFVHQYYKDLINNKSKKCFEHTLNKTIFAHFTNAENYIKKSSDENVCKVINQYGISHKNFMYRIHFAKNRLLRKYKNAYELYKIKYPNDINLNEVYQRFEESVKVEKKYPILSGELEFFMSDIENFKY